MIPYFEDVDKLLPIAILRNINVDDEFQNLGVGSELLEDFIDRAVFLGASSIILEAQADDPKKQAALYRFYNNYGFVLLSDKNLMLLEL